jgi:hypothetical protein
MDSSFFSQNGRMVLLCVLLKECSNFEKIVELFLCTVWIALSPCCMDIHVIVSTDVETVVLMSKVKQELPRKA